MSRLIPFVLAGTGAAATSVGGVYLIRGTGSAAGEKSTGSPTLTLFETLTAFKTAKGDSCVKGLFGDGVEINSVDSVAEISTSSPTGDTYFGAAPTDGQEKAEGCLIINWKKTEYTGDNGKVSGTFTWSWSFKNRDKGFIIFGIAKTKEANKFTVTGGTYLLANETSGTTKKWNVKHKKEETTGKDLSNSDFDNKFPKSKSSSTIKIGSGDHWDFITKEKLGNMCGGEACPTSGSTPKENSKKWIWKWQSGSNGVKITDWTEKLDWWEHIHNVTGFNLSTKLQSFVGAWSEATEGQ